MVKTFLFVGTYTENTASKGIYCFEVLAGRFLPRGHFSDCINPSYLALGGKRLYAVNEMADGARVSTFSIQPNGTLRLKNELEVPGCGMCHLSLHPSLPVLFVSNFGSGDFVSCLLTPDGTPAAVQAHVCQTGGGPVAGAQDASHLHAAMPDARGEHLVTCNLGNDQITVYSLQAGRYLQPCGEPLRLPAGSGPRHLSFSPDERFVYVVNELANTVSILCWNAGKPELIATQPLFPRPFQGACYAADLHFSKDGRFLYISTREQDGIVCFAVKKDTGALAQTAVYPSDGRWPRHFSFSPQEHMIAVANQKSDRVNILARDLQTGALGPVLCRLPVPSPVCALWVELVM